MNNYVPKFYQYPMPDQSPFEAAVKGTFGGMDAMSKLKSAQSDRDVNQQNIAASKQTMEQSAQKFPLALEKAKVDIAKIKDDMTLTPYQKQLYMAQVANQYASAAKEKAETSKIGKEMTQVPAPLSPIGKVIHDYANTTDPEHKKILENAMQKMSSSDEFAPVTELDKLKVKDFADNSKQTNEQAKAAANVINDLNIFAAQRSQVPSAAKGTAYSVAPGYTKYATRLLGGSDEAAAIDAAEATTNRLVLSTGQMLKNQRGITIALLKLIQDQKPHLGQTDEGSKRTSDAIMAAALQKVEYAKLLNTVAESNIPDHKKQSIVDDIWDKTENKYPVIDANGNINKENASKWQDVMKEELGGESSDDQGKVLVISPDGKKGYIPKNQLDQAVNQGYKLTQ
jgi:hypothetical protein